MRWIIHTVAVLAYVIAMYLLGPVTRIGVISYFSAIFYGLMAAVAAYAVAVLGIGLLTGTPISKWPQVARQLFCAARKHDG